VNDTYGHIAGDYVLKEVASVVRTRLRPDDDHVVSRGYACPKGLAAHEVTHDPDRIVHPMKRTAAGWERISWEQAIGEIGPKLNAIRAAHGPDAIALYTGNPSGYAYAHRIYSANWIKALGSRNSYGAGSQDNLADFLAARFLYGASFRQPVPDVDRTGFDPEVLRAEVDLYMEAWNEFGRELGLGPVLDKEVLEMLLQRKLGGVFDGLVGRD
jgi:anaerobic selenocysteine-containing dehydrogenase